MAFIKLLNGLRIKRKVIMFVSELSQEEKIGLVQLVTSIAKADGNIAEEEVNFLTSYARDHGVSFDINVDIDLEQACSLIKSPKGKIIAIQELVKIAISDGHYDESEKLGARAIASLLSLPLKTFEEVESWVIEGQRWVQKGEEMVANA